MSNKTDDWVIWEKVSKSSRSYLLSIKSNLATRKITSWSVSPLGQPSPNFYWRHEATYNLKWLFSQKWILTTRSNNFLQSSQKGNIYILWNKYILLLSWKICSVFCASKLDYPGPNFIKWSRCDSVVPWRMYAPWNPHIPYT